MGPSVFSSHPQLTQTFIRDRLTHKCFSLSHIEVNYLPPCLPFSLFFLLSILRKKLAFRFLLNLPYHVTQVFSCEILLFVAWNVHTVVLLPILFSGYFCSADARVVYIVSGHGNRSSSARFLHLICFRCFLDAYVIQPSAKLVLITQIHKNIFMLIKWLLCFSGSNF